jgi:antigen flippase
MPDELAVHDAWPPMREASDQTSQDRGAAIGDIRRQASSPSPSYSRVLKSTSIVGGSAAIGMLISMGAVKGGALLVGPSGIGELRLYQAALGFAGALFGMGLGPATVRRISHAIAKGDPEAAERSAAVLHRLALLTGLTGWIALAAAATPLGALVFDDDVHAASLAIAGTSIVLATMNAGYVSELQARQQVATLAWVRLSSSAMTAVLSIACFWWLGAAGIVPSIVASSAASLLIARRSTNAGRPNPRIAAPHVSTCVRDGLGLAGLGLAMMTPSILASLVTAITGSLIVRHLDIGANGLLSAATGMSVLFASFILNAMEADYFPRLSAAHDDPPAMRRIVNEQTEIGILLALPGIMATLVLAPLAINVFYSQAFEPAADLLVWLVLGVFARVTAWPISLVLLARADSKTYLLNEVAFACLQIAMIALALERFGLVGVAIVYPIQMALYNAVMLEIVRRRAGVTWSASVSRLIVVSILLAGTCLLLRFALQDGPRLAAGIALTIVASLFSARGLSLRLGPAHRLVAPLLRWRIVALGLGIRR